MQPLVEPHGASGLYSVRLSARLDVRRLVAILMLALMTAYFLYAAVTETKASEIISAVLLLLFFSPFLVVNIHRALRAKYGFVQIDANREELIVTETFLRLRPPLRIPRASIDGFWVACGVEESGQPLPSYSLMLDRNLAKVCVVPDIQLVQPAIALAEDLAMRMNVPTYTRGSHLR